MLNYTYDMPGRSQRSFEDTFNCPNCGADVPTNAAACPVCGSDEDTGWSENTIYDNLDLPDNDYDDTEGRYENRSTNTKKDRWIKVTAVLLLILILFYVLIGLW